jgi:hypothetical protein
MNRLADFLVEADRLSQRNSSVKAALQYKLSVSRLSFAYKQLKVKSCGNTRCRAVEIEASMV